MNKPLAKRFCRIPTRTGEPKQFFEDTVSRIESVKKGILQTHLRTVAGPSQWLVAVEAYSVLCHAAFEEFVESISEYSVSKILYNLMNKKPLPRYAALFMSHYYQGPAIINPLAIPQTSEFDTIRTLFNSAKQSHSKVVHKNHGISIDQLRSLLVPTGMYIEPNSSEKDSLERLIKQRHTVAHLGMDLQNERQEASSRIQSPEDVVSLVEDSCIPYFKKIFIKASEYNYY